MAEEKGTGKHPHKSTEEPYPHHEASTTRGQSESRSQQQASGGSQQRGSSKTSQGGSTSDPKDLKQREYRDKDGNIHHHTHTSQEMKEK